MERKNSESTDRLLETIRQELVTFINDKETTKASTKDYEVKKINEQKKRKPSTNQKNVRFNSNIKILDTDKNVKSQAATTTTTTTKEESRASGGTDGMTKPLRNKDLLPEEILDALNDTKAAEHSNFLEGRASQNIDENLQKMQLDLKQSYELFQSISGRFENIDFGCLKSRIKDLHLNAAKDAEGKSTTAELKAMFDMHFDKNRLDKLTTDMGDHFRAHPGEFGDIPELSAFFKTCSNLMQGLEQLRRQRNDVRDLSNNLEWATGVSNNRIAEIRKSLKEDK